MKAGRMVNSKKSEETRSTSFGKLLSILECFTIAEPELSAIQLRERLNIPYSTLYRYLQMLVREGFLEHNTEHNTYYIGLSVVELSGIALSRFDVRRLGQKDMVDLAMKLNVNTNMGILREGDLFHLDFSVRINTSPAYTVIGRRVPAHQTAMGKVLLAQLQFNEVMEIIDKYGWRRSTQNSIDNFEQLKEELVKVKQQDYAIDDQESTEYCCIAMPVWQQDGKVVAAVSLTTTKERFDSEFEILKNEIYDTAISISYKLGYLGKSYQGYSI